MENNTGVLIAVSSVLGICIGILLEYFLNRWRQWEIVQAVKQAVLHRTQYILGAT